MHQILFRLGLSPKPRWGDYSARRDPLAGRRPTSKGRKGREKEGRELRKEREGKKYSVPPPTFE